MGEKDIRADEPTSGDVVSETHDWPSVVRDVETLAMAEFDAKYPEWWNDPLFVERLERGAPRISAFN